MRRRHKISFVIGNAISIHAPRAGCDYLRKSSPPKTDVIFQSTHPVRGATITFSEKCVDKQDFNPRTPCGVRRSFRKSSVPRPPKFQSTHPVRGATPIAAHTVGKPCDFNPRTPCGVRLHLFRRGRLFLQISIHAPRAGCDFDDFPRFFNRHAISIHAPRAGCDCIVCDRCIGDWQFQSTHPVRGATRCKVRTVQLDHTISIHAPRAGCDNI